MTTLAAGSSATINLRDGGAVNVATNGGAATVTVTPTGGEAQVTSFGPLPQRASFGDYTDGAVVVISNQSATLNYEVTGANVQYFNDSLVVGDQVVALSEVTDYVTRTTTGTAFSGACEFAGYVCTVAAGNITIYDNTSAAGTVIVPTTALAVGAFPIFGAGTNGKMALTTGCHVVLSGAATVNVLVG